LQFVTNIITFTYSPMSENCRFAFAVHTMSVLALHPDEPMTSEVLAQSVNTNPVVIRRLLSELAHAGLVETQRGPGGGANLARSATQITLAQIHRAAVGDFAPFGEHPNTPAQGCKVGRNIKQVLENVAARAAAAIEREYDATSLADIVHEISGQPVSALGQ
jgi:Rrf2 family protein